jgi:hypothetical protein
VIGIEANRVRPSLKVQAAVLFMVLLGALFPNLMAADSSPEGAALLDQMSDQERKETGIERLTAAEREKLNAWIASRIGDGTPTADESAAARSAAVAGAGSASTPAAPVPSDSTPTPASPVAEPVAAQTDAQSAGAQPANPSAKPEESIERIALTEGSVRGIPESVTAFTTRIVGQFVGWQNKTRFRLENGQVWQQRTTSKYRYKAENPEVRLSRNFLGFWEMEIVDTGRSVGVKRIDGD